MSDPDPPSPGSPSLSRGPSLCRRCIHFDDDPGRFEAAFPGITILSSGYGDSKGTTGLCQVLERAMQPDDTCERFEPGPLPRP